MRVAEVFALCFNYLLNNGANIWLSLIRFNTIKLIGQRHLVEPGAMSSCLDTQQQQCIFLSKNIVSNNILTFIECISKYSIDFTS